MAIENGILYEAATAYGRHHESALSRFLRSEFDLTNWVAKHCNESLNASPPKHTLKSAVGLRQNVLFDDQSCPSSYPCPASSIQLLPIEILGEIFAHYVQGGDVPDAFGYNICYSQYSNADPRVLELVSRLWRNILRSNGALWSSLYISRPVTEHVRIAQTWLKRAGKSLLTLHLSQSFMPTSLDIANGYQESFETTQQLLSLFLSRFHYWRDIEFHVYDGSFALPFLSIPSVPPPNLCRASLNFRCRHDTSKYNIDHVWQVLHSSKSLRTVDWSGAYSEKSTFLSNIPWTSLTSIALESRISMDSLLDIVSSAKKLESLSICYLVSEAKPRDLITHPILRKISIQASMVQLAPFFDSLKLPSLEYIDVGQNLGPALSRGGKSFSKLLARSKCTLKSLSIRDAGMSEDQLLEFLPFPLLMSLSELSVFGVETITDRTIDLLTWKKDVSSSDSDSVAPVLPLLEEISLETCTLASNSLSSMILSRLSHQTGSATLRSVLLEIRDGRAEELQALQNLGEAHEHVLLMIICNTSYDEFNS